MGSPNNSLERSILSEECGFLFYFELFFFLSCVVLLNRAALWPKGLLSASPSEKCAFRTLFAARLGTRVNDASM